MNKKEITEFQTLKNNIETVRAKGVEKLKLPINSSIETVIDNIKSGGGIKFTLTRGNVMPTAAIIFGEKQEV